MTLYDTPRQPRGPHRRWIPRLVLAGVVLTVFVWLITMISAIHSFDDHANSRTYVGRYSACTQRANADLTAAIATMRKQRAVGDARLDVAGAAVNAFASAEKWSYVESSPAFQEFDARETVLAYDGDVLHRTNKISGFETLVGDGHAIARYDESTYWIPACVGVPLLDVAFTNARCVAVAESAATITSTWELRQDDRCGEGTFIRFDVTTADSKLVSWKESISGQSPTTFRVLPSPESISTPLPIFIAPEWLAKRVIG